MNQAKAERLFERDLIDVVKKKRDYWKDVRLCLISLLALWGAFCILTDLAYIALNRTN